IILPDSFIRYHYPPVLTFVFPVNIAPDVEPVNSGNTGQGVSTKGLGYIYPSRSIPIPGALFHHTRDILLIV
ncbi:hypothetical protein ACNRYF_004591, partial [Salmonella enterica subsp. enterica serovar Senftenberg]